MALYVEGGTVSAGQVYVLVTAGTINLGTTVLAFQAVAIPTNQFVGTTVAGTTYTLVLTDTSKRLNLTNAAAKTITIPAQTGGGGVAFPVNTTIEIFNVGAGLATIAGNGFTPNGTLTIPQFSKALAKKRANPNTWDVSDVSAILPDRTANLTAGHTATAFNDGTVSSGTLTPASASGGFHRYVNGGAHTLAPPTVSPGDSTTVIIQITNNGSAGAITTSGFTIPPKGDAFTTVNGADFMCVAVVCNGFSTLTVTALQ